MQLLDWYPPERTAHAECSLLYVVTFDTHTRFVKLRTAVKVHADYCMLDWAIGSGTPQHTLDSGPAAG